MIKIMKKFRVLLVLSVLLVITSFCHAKKLTSYFEICDSCYCVNVDFEYEISRKRTHDKYTNRISMINVIEYTIMEELEKVDSIESWTSDEFNDFMHLINGKIQETSKDFYPSPNFRLIFGNYKSTKYCLDDTSGK